MKMLLFAFVALFSSNMAFKLEQSCSKFHYEEQTLEKIIRLQMFVEKIKEEVDSSQLQVRDELNNLAKEREKFHAEFQGIKDTIEATTNSVNEDDLTTAKLQQSIKQLADDVLKIQESTMQPVAFQSSNVEDMKMTNNKMIVFSKYTINFRDSYNTQSGTFTVPIKGIYIFAVQLSLHVKSYAYFGIYVNETLVQTGLIGDPDFNNIFTLVAIVDVTKDDLVTVRCISSCEGDSLYRNTYTSSSFSGVLIHGK